MRIDEIINPFGNRTEKKRQAAIDKVRAKEKAKIASDKKAIADAEVRRELQKEIDAGEAKRAAAAKNTEKRNLKN